MINNILLVEEHQGWVAFNIDYGDFVSQGKTIQEAKRNMEKIIADALMHKEINIIKKESRPIDFKEYLKNIYGEDFKEIKQYILSDLDISHFLKIENASKSERTNVSIKRGYKVLAKLHKINISEFLNKKLSQELGTKF